MTISKTFSIEHLILIAGPTACGKTTFIDALRSGKVGQFCKFFPELENIAEFHICSKIHLIPELDFSVSKKVLLHYDFLWLPYTQSDMNSRGGGIDDLMRRAAKYYFDYQGFCREITTSTYFK